MWPYIKYHCHYCRTLLRVPLDKEHSTLPTVWCKQLIHFQYVNAGKRYRSEDLRHNTKIALKLHHIALGSMNSCLIMHYNQLAAFILRRDTWYDKGLLTKNVYLHCPVHLWIKQELVLNSRVSGVFYIWIWIRNLHSKSYGMVTIMLQLYCCMGNGQKDGKSDNFISA